MSFYLWAMRSASVLLFVYAVIVLIAALLMQFWALGAMPSYGPGLGEAGLVRMLTVITAALGSAALPLFGAALLWRADAWLARGTGVAGGAE